MLGVQGAIAEGLDSVHVAHFLQILIVPNLDLLDLVGGAEAVEEVQEGNAALDGGQMGNRAQVHDFLDVGLSQHGKAGLAAGHHVAVVAKDVQGVAGQGTGADVENTGKQLAGDLVHVGDHQQQALGGGVGGGQSAGIEGTMNGAGSAGLRLHLLHLDSRAKNVLAALGGPLVDIVSHGAGRGDGVDGGYFSEGVGYVGGGVVAVHGFEVSLHISHLHEKKISYGGL